MISGVTLGSQCHEVIGFGPTSLTVGLPFTPPDPAPSHPGLERGYFGPSAIHGPRKSQRTAALRDERLVKARPSPATRNRSSEAVAIRDMPGWRDRSCGGTLISDQLLAPAEVRPDVGTALASLSASGLI
jgi:hypothetical protein